jgi:DNA invertase Pin-like site-specific DNA recombinase
MADTSVNVVVNNLRGIQAEINRLDIMKLEKLNIRKKYITDCLNKGVSVKQIATLLDISNARVYKILEELKVQA